jgi:hypothetical protein
MTLGCNSKEIIPFGMADKNHSCGCARLTIFFGHRATSPTTAKQNENNQYEFTVCFLHWTSFFA